MSQPHRRRLRPRRLGRRRRRRSPRCRCAPGGSCTPACCPPRRSPVDADAPPQAWRASLDRAPATPATGCWSPWSATGWSASPSPPPPPTPTATRSPTPSCELTVDPRERGKGHGSRLLQAAVDTMHGRPVHPRGALAIATDDDAARVPDRGRLGARRAPTASSTSTGPARRSSRSACTRRSSRGGARPSKLAATGNHGGTQVAASGSSRMGATPCSFRCRSSTARSS